MDVISMKDIRKSYAMGDSVLNVLKGIDLTVKEGEFLGESSGRFILSTSFRVCNTVERKTLPLCWDKYYKNIISCCKSGINRILLIFVVG